MTLTSQIDCQRSSGTSAPPETNTPAFEQNRSIRRVDPDTGLFVGLAGRGPPRRVQLVRVASRSVVAGVDPPPWEDPVPTHESQIGVAAEIENLETAVGVTEQHDGRGRLGLDDCGRLAHGT